VANRIARISNDDYLSPKSKMNLQETGVSLAVSKTGAIGLELFNIISHPGATQVVELFDRRVQVVGFQVHMDSPLIRAPLQEVADMELLNKLRVIAAMRGDEMIVPRGDTRFLIGDIVYVASQPENIQSLLKWASPEYAMFDKVVIGGGGTLGRNLARRLESTPSQIVIIESDKAQAYECSSLLQRTLVLHGNALTEGMLVEVGIVPRTAFVATTGSDENNIISCLLAEKLGATFTLAQINKREYLSIINSQSLLDRAVSSYVAMTNEVLHFMRARQIKSATLVRTLPGELIEVRLAPEHKWVGRRIQDLKLPKGTVIASTLRDGKVQVPTGGLELSAGDYLLIFAQPDSVRRLESLFRD
jgi:trk system potassium uptake protein TrkA